VPSALYVQNLFSFVIQGCQWSASSYQIRAQHIRNGRLDASRDWRVRGSNRMTERVRGRIVDFLLVQGVTDSHPADLDDLCLGPQRNRLPCHLSPLPCTPTEQNAEALRQVLSIIEANPVVHPSSPPPSVSAFSGTLNMRAERGHHIPSPQ
jgi:hypothetical protein